MFREVLQRSKQLEISRFLPRISYFHHNGHSDSYPTGLLCQNGNFAVVAHIFLKFFRRSMATFWGLAGHFWPVGHRLGTTGLDIVVEQAELFLMCHYIIFHVLLRSSCFLTKTRSLFPRSLHLRDRQLPYGDYMWFSQNGSVTMTKQEVPKWKCC